MIAADDLDWTLANAVKLSDVQPLDAATAASYGLTFAIAAAQILLASPIGAPCRGWASSDRSTGHGGSSTRCRALTVEAGIELAVALQSLG